MEIARGTPESRLQPRFAVLGWCASVEWWDEDVGREAFGELVNISAGGALLLVRGAPRAGLDVSFCVEGLEPRVRLPAVVVEARPGQLGCRVHLEFSGPCPLVVLDAVVVARAD